MKPLKIAQRYRPFSHEPGTDVLIPKSNVSVKVYPTRIEMMDIALDFSIKGPIDRFTVMQNLEKMRVEVSGFSEEGYFRYFLVHEGKQVLLQVKKGKWGYCESNSEEKFLKAGDQLAFAVPIEAHTPKFLQRLSLGSSKAQDIDLMRRRQDLREILPLWFYLSQMTPEVEENPTQNNVELLNLFNVGFTGLFSPCKGNRHLGLKAPENPFLQGSAEYIRKLFYKKEGDNVYILPKLPREFCVGRLLSITEENVFSLDLEWSKGLIRRMVLRSLREGSFKFHFQSEIKECRISEGKKENFYLLKNGESFTVKQDATYYFDRFLK